MKVVSNADEVWKHLYFNLYCWWISKFSKGIFGFWAWEWLHCKWLLFSLKWNSSVFTLFLRFMNLAASRFKPKLAEYPDW